MKISIGADHRGYALKQNIIQHFTQLQWEDVGTHSAERTDYPLFAQQVCKNILTRRTEAGILLCGSGNGVAIAANRFKGIYAALCWTPILAQRAKEHDGANVLVLPADYISMQDAYACVQAWLSASFLGGRYQNRLDMLDAFCHPELDLGSK